MLSVVIPTRDSEDVLLHTLAALVPGAAAGMVREVIVADGGSRDDTAAIADGAGCRLLTSSEPHGTRLNIAARDARAAWLLFLTPGMVPDTSWIDETGRFIERTELRGRTDGEAAVFRAATGELRSTWGDALVLLRGVLGRGFGAGGSLLIAKRFYESLGGHRAVAEPERDLLRRLGRRRLVFLRTGAVAAQPRAIR